MLYQLARFEYDKPSFFRETGYFCLKEIIVKGEQELSVLYRRRQNWRVFFLYDADIRRNFPCSWVGQYAHAACAHQQK